MRPGRAASSMALSMRPMGSTHTGQPGPWIMFTLARQHVLQAVARDGVRVAAAELHQVVAAAGVGLAGDGSGQLPRQLAVAEFVDVLHVMARAGVAAAVEAGFGEGPQRLLGFFGIEPRQRKAHVHDDVVADRDALHQGQRDLLAHAAEFDDGVVAVGQLDDTGGEGEAHRWISFKEWRRPASATQAWPSERPPSLGGTAWASSMARARARRVRAAARRPAGH